MNSSDCQKQDKAIIEIEYGITIEEEEKAFKLFQRLYVFKKNIIKTVLFLIAAAAFAVQIICGRGDSIAWGLLTVCLAFTAVVWITPLRVRKFLLQALEMLKDDRYILRVFSGGFEIETVVPRDGDAAEEETQQEEEDNEDGEESGAPINTVSAYSFDDEKLRLVESDESYLIFIGKETFHVLPKRAIGDELSEAVRKDFVGRFGHYTRA